MRRLLVPVLFALVLTVGVSGARADVDPLVRASGPTPFAPNCNGAPEEGTLYRNAEVEPYVDVNPADSRNVVGVWQQDRWDNGGSQGNLTAFSTDRARSWTRPTPPPFTRCAGGTARNGGDYERASDPWVSFGPDGTAHQIALTFSGLDISAILVASSRDGGRTWGPVKTLQRDTTATLSNDKESITADPTNARFVYAVWDRLQIADPDDPNSDFSGDTLFARSTDGGRTWEPTLTILDFADNSNVQTIGNQIHVLGDGTLVNVFDLIDDQGNTQVAVQRSTNRGATWSAPIVVDLLFTSAITEQGGVIDPSDGHLVRTGDILPDGAADPQRGSHTLHVVWQDLRLTLLGEIAIDQIVMATSTDGGLTWSDPKRISGNRGVQAFTGSVHVNEDGQIGVTYYDFTFDDPAGGPLNTDYWFTASRNGGLTFTPRERLTARSFDMRTAPDAGGFFTGDYEGLAASESRFVPFVVLANSGNTFNRTDVFSTVVRPSFGGSPFALAAPARPAAPVQRGLDGPVRIR